MKTEPKPKLYVIRQKGSDENLCKPTEFAEISEGIRRATNEGFENLYIQMFTGYLDNEQQKESTKE